MAYEHISEARAVASSLENILALAKDEIPNQQQIAQFLAEALGTVNTVTAVMSSEEKGSAEAKFIIYATVLAAQRYARNLNVEPKTKTTLIRLLQAGLDILDIQIPDEDALGKSIATALKGESAEAVA